MSDRIATATTETHRRGASWVIRDHLTTIHQTNAAWIWVRRREKVTTCLTAPNRNPNGSRSQHHALTSSICMVLTRKTHRTWRDLSYPMAANDSRMAQWLSTTSQTTDNDGKAMATRRTLDSPTSTIKTETLELRCRARTRRTWIDVIAIPTRLEVSWPPHLMSVLAQIRSSLQILQWINRETTSIHSSRTGSSRTPSMSLQMATTGWHQEQMSQHWRPWRASSGSRMLGLLPTFLFLEDIQQDINQFRSSSRTPTSGCIREMFTTHFSGISLTRGPLKALHKASRLTSSSRNTLLRSCATRSFANKTTMKKIPSDALIATHMITHRFMNYSNWWIIWTQLATWNFSSMWTRFKPEENGSSPDIPGRLVIRNTNVKGSDRASWNKIWKRNSAKNSASSMNPKLTETSHGVVQSLSFI